MARDIKQPKILVLCILLIFFTFVPGCSGSDETKQPIELKKLSDTIWLMNDNNEASGFIVLGTEKAAVIDTMNGGEDIKALVRTVTSLPLVVINTHGHMDHVYGNAYFDEVYLHPDDLDLAKETYTYSDYRKLKSRFDLPEVNFLTVNNGDVFDLGGITLEAYSVPGHTHGSICLLDRSDRVLFAGDAINRHTWMQLESRTSLETAYESLKSLSSIRGEFDRILHGHLQDFEDASLYEDHMAALKEVIDGVNENDTSYEYFGGTCIQHPYTKGNITIVYNKNDVTQN